MKQTNIRKHALDAMREVSKDFGLGLYTNREHRDTGDCLCLIGLACEAYRRETGKGKWTEPDMGSLLDNPVSHFVVGDDCSMLPFAVSEWMTSDRRRPNVQSESLWYYHDIEAHETWEAEFADLAPAEEIAQ